jgi:hypothetical protein
MNTDEFMHLPVGLAPVTMPKIEHSGAVTNSNRWRPGDDRLGSSAKSPTTASACDNLRFGLSPLDSVSVREQTESFESLGIGAVDIP